MMIDNNGLKAMKRKKAASLSCNHPNDVFHNDQAGAQRKEAKQ